MLEWLRRLIGADRMDKLVPEQRDREDGLRNAQRARQLAERLREEDQRAARRHEMELRFGVRGRR